MARVTTSGVAAAHSGQEKAYMPVGAASSFRSACQPAPPSAPAGQAALANAQQLGVGMLRLLTPRANVSPSRSASPERRHGYDHPSMQAFAPPESVGAAIFLTTDRLNQFAGGGLSAIPLVGQAPVFDARLAEDSANRSKPPRPAAPEPRISLKPHTSEFMRSPRRPAAKGLYAM